MVKRKKKKICLQCRRPGFNPWVGKVPWRRKWQPTLVFLHGKSQGQRSLAGYSPWGHKESDMTEWAHKFPLLQSRGSRPLGFSSCGSQAPEHRLNSCGAWAQLLHSMWNLSGPEFEPMSPALAGGFFTTKPPRKSHIMHFFIHLPGHFFLQKCTVHLLCTR